MDLLEHLQGCPMWWDTHLFKQLRRVQIHQIHYGLLNIQVISIQNSFPKWDTRMPNFAESQPVGGTSFSTMVLAAWWDTHLFGRSFPFGRVSIDNLINHAVLYALKHSCIIYFLDHSEIYGY